MFPLTSYNELHAFLLNNNRNVPLLPLLLWSLTTALTQRSPHPETIKAIAINNPEAKPRSRMSPKDDDRVSASDMFPSDSVAATQSAREAAATLSEHNFARSNGAHG